MTDNFKTWEEVKNQPHDISGITNPESYLYERSGSEGHEGIYYPRLTKQQALKSLILEHLEYDYRDMRDRVVNRVLNSGAIDVDGWNPEYNRMILVHSVLIALFDSSADNRKATGTSFEKEVKSNVKNIRCFV